MQHLEKEVEETAEVVREWKAKVQAIEVQIAESTQAVAIATKHRQKHALASSLGDHAAITAIKTARADEHESAQRLADLAVALPAAQSALAEAEKVAESARRAVAKVMAEQLMKNRVAVSGQIDQKIADLARLLDEYEKLGNEIVNTPDVVNRSIFGVANNEAAIGLRRVRAALPKLFDHIYPNAQYDEMKKEILAASEARHWNLPAESETKAA